MTLTLLVGAASRRAKPGSVAWRRWRQDPALAALGRTDYVLSSRRSLASLASDAPGA